MNYIKITPLDVANGPGCRVVLWVAGCSHHCKGCHNPQTWNLNEGSLFDDKAMEKLLSAINSPFIDGITLSGGDPLHPNNVEKITEVCRILKQQFPNKNIWCYTGYLYEDIKDYDIMKYLDVLVDGPFVLEQRNLMLLFRGSENQRLINIPETRKYNEIILYEQEN
jgi:anaerobic ribonucleoside-triphosphate reductase activating protein